MSLEAEFLRRAAADEDRLSASTWRLAAALLATSGLTALVDRIASWSEYGDAPDVEDMRSVLNWAIREARAVLDPNNLEGPGRTSEEMAAEHRELNRIAPTPADKLALMFRGVKPE